MNTTQTTSSSSSSSYSRSNSNKPSRILFGSCNSQHYSNNESSNIDKENTIWDAMSKRRDDATQNNVSSVSTMVWVGDAIYGDDYNKNNGTIRIGTPSILNELYTQLINHPKYQSFTRRRTNHPTVNKITSESTTSSHILHNQNNSMTVLGVWDDHDYGVNNGDVRYKYRIESALLYLKFIKHSNHKPIDLSIMEQRAKSGNGLYGVKVIDYTKSIGNELLSDEDAGIEPYLYITNHTDNTTIRIENTRQQQSLLSNQSVAIFLLDCRSNKSPWITTIPKKYTLNYDGDFLGNEQWEWFQSALQRSTAAVNIIVQGLQVHADRYFDGNLVEDWSRFPMAQHKLYQTILSSNVQVPILISGDVHMSELLQRNCRQRQQQKYSNNNLVTNDNYSPSRMLLEVTVSGMTHSWCSNTCARPQSGLICRNRWIQLALCTGMHIAHHTSVWTDLISTNHHVPNNDYNNHQQKNAKSGIQYVLERNFGELEFDWKERQVIVRIFDINGNALIQTGWSFDVLSGMIEPSMTNNKLQLSDYEKTYQRLYTNYNHNSTMIVQPTDWICLNHNGISSFSMKLLGVIIPIGSVIFIATLPINILIIVLWLMWRHRCRQYRIKSKLKQL